MAHLAAAAAAGGDGCATAGVDWGVLDEEEAALLLPYSVLLPFDVR